MLVTGVLLSTWTYRLLAAHRDLVVHNHEVIEMAKDVLIGLDDAETGQRGYLLSGEPRYLAPHGHARERLGTMAPALKGMLADNAEQTSRFGHLATLIAKKLDELQGAITARDERGFDAALKLELSSTDMATMGAIRHDIGQITEGEKTLLSARDAEVSSDERRVQIVAILVGVASLLTRASVELYLMHKAAPGTASCETATERRQGPIEVSETPGRTAQRRRRGKAARRERCRATER